MEYCDLLKQKAAETKSIVCFGIDPQLDRMPLKEGDVEQKILNFYSDILEACEAEDAKPSALKPNYAYFAQYGTKGLQSLKKIIEKFKQLGYPIIFDGKRGDIGATSGAYAKEVFDFWQADACTVSPYMGSDSVSPFVKFAELHGRGVYILCRTSNSGAKDFQDLSVGGKKLYTIVAEKILEWAKNAKGNLGAVVGATSMSELQEIALQFAKSGRSVPLLIPGVGTQGGSGKEVADTLKKCKIDLGLQRINSSSGIAFAFEREKSSDYAGAAVKEIKRLNKEIGLV